MAMPKRRPPLRKRRRMRLKLEKRPEPSRFMLYATPVGAVLLTMLVGAIWGAIPALLKTRFNVNETLTSLMMTYVAIHMMNYFVTGPWKDPSGFSFPQTAMVTADQTMPTFDVISLIPGLTTDITFNIH